MPSCSTAAPVARPPLLVATIDEAVAAMDPLRTWIISPIGTVPSVWSLTLSGVRTASSAMLRERRARRAGTVGMRSATC